ncbi:YtxH domain-containing protein [Formosa sp. S-31]
MLNDGKNVAIIAHLTIIGWIIAFVLNGQNKTEFASFYIRQVLGIGLLGLLAFIPVIGVVIGFFAFILWIMSLVNALGNNTKPVFLLGDKFQEWFKGL